MRFISICKFSISAIQQNEDRWFCEVRSPFVGLNLVKVHFTHLLELKDLNESLMHLQLPLVSVLRFANWKIVYSACRKFPCYNKSNVKYHVVMKILKEYLGSAGFRLNRSCISCMSIHRKKNNKDIHQFVKPQTHWQLPAYGLNNYPTDFHFQ